MSLASADITILGIDPGYDRVGWAVGTLAKGKVTNLSYGIIQTDKTVAITDRYQQIVEELRKVVTQYQPTEVGVETLFFSKNTTTALRVSEARGVIIGTLLQNQIKLFEYNPMQIKLAVTGYGKATKQDMDKMIRLQLKLPTQKLVDDTMDAIGVLLTHSASRPLSQALI